MAATPDAPRPSTEPNSTPQPPTRRRRRITPATRTAAMFLLLVWFGPVTFVQTDSWSLLAWTGAPRTASADVKVIPAGHAIELEPGTLIKLHLRDGRVVEGQYVGRALLDSALYAKRFEEKSRGSAYVPLAMGETLHVALRDGREWIAPFAGYAELTLLLQNPDSAGYLQVPFEFAKGIQRANGDPVDPAELGRAYHSGLLPSAEALVLSSRVDAGTIRERWEGGDRIAVEEIASATANLSSGANVGGIIFVSVLAATVVVLFLVGLAMNDASKQCGKAYVPPTQLVSEAGIHLTTRRFDRSRGCFVGDDLAVAGPWPAMVAADSVAAPYPLAGMPGK